MNCTPNQTNGSRPQGARGFTLIEMIGVLAVIAILAALLVPKVFSAISDARVNNAAVSCDTVKTALADHYGKYGSLPVDGSTTPPTVLSLPVAQFDLVLLKESLLDKPFAVKIGDGTSGATNSRIQVLSLSGVNPGTTVTDADTSTTSTGFALSGGNTNSITGSVLVEAVITGVTEADAQALSQRIDGTGPDMSSAIGTHDVSGRVKYATGSPTTVFIYLTHR